ncbi:MAG: histidine kinase dimerization/phosphoacceptor domain -containing protein [Deltaproteobacteria bacterium]
MAISGGRSPAALTVVEALGATREQSRGISRIAITALAYWLAAKAALWMAIEPGYATPVWPAAGFALCAVLLWGKPTALGVVVGSTAANLATSLDPASSFSIAGSLGVALGIGCGAGLQALLGAWLIERFVGLPVPLEAKRSIGRFAILGGPVACVASASVGVSTLVLAGLLSWANFPFSWATWWVGDSIGVVIFAPLSLILIANPGVLWQRSRSTFTLPLLGSVTVVTLLFWQTRAASFGGQPGWRAWLVLGIGLWFMRVMSTATLVSVGSVTQAQKSAEEGERRSLELEERVRVRTAELSATLEEREVLLQEIHHRVKNNLQVISSLINLQVRRLEDSPSRDALTECQARVYTIALIHETLYESRDYSEMPFSDYVRSLATSVFQLAGSPGTISLALELEPVRLPVDRAIPCGLILNELIMNALKHAFPDGRSGCISVQLRHRDAGRVALVVRDDGIGVQEAVDPKNGELGMQLVATLAQQIRADLSVKRAAGTTVELEFAGRG